MAVTRRRVAPGEEVEGRVVRLESVEAVVWRGSLHGVGSVGDKRLWVASYASWS